MVSNINDHMAYACDCGSVHFNLIRSCKLECTRCGKYAENYLDYLKGEIMKEFPNIEPLPTKKEIESLKSKIVMLEEKVKEYDSDLRLIISDLIGGEKEIYDFFYDGAPSTTARIINKYKI